MTDVSSGIISNLIFIKLTNQGDLKLILHKPNPRDWLIWLEYVCQQSGSNHVGHRVTFLLSCHFGLYRHHFSQLSTCLKDRLDCH